MEDKTPHKILVEREIYRETKSKPFTWADLKSIEFEDGDRIEVAYDEGHVSENDSWDPHFYAVVTRMVEETDEQFKKRMDRVERDKQWARERRYESYLRLRAEFENEKP